jgi:uncharacterized protein (TIGR03000 family)
VTINGHLTKTGGTRREYVSYGLRAGLVYKYVIRARVVRDGEPLERTRTIRLKAGGRIDLVLDFSSLPVDRLAAAR